MGPSTETYQPNWHVKALSAPGPDTDLSLHVSFDNARFLFGCGEGTQRAFTQKRMGMRGLSAIFVGSGEARSRAGLAGVLMTAADGGISKVDIVGPPDLSHYISTLRSSVIRDSLTVNMHSIPRSTSSGESVELFKSPNITVNGIALIPESQPTAGPSSSNYIPFDPYSSSFRPSRISPSDAQKWCDQIVADIFHNGPKARASRRPYQPPAPSSDGTKPRSRSPSPRRTANPFVNPDGTICSSIPDTRYPLPLPSRQDVNTQMVYICQAPDVRGKFNVEKANQLGVPKGPARGKLTKGEEIEVDDPSVEGGKRVVKPEECLVGGGPGSVLIVVNCSEQTKPALLQNTSFHKYQPFKAHAEGLEPRRVHLIVHRVPRAVWDTEDYKEWMKAFGERTQHLIADPVNYPDRTVFNSAAWNTLQLSLADPEIFVPPFVQSPHSSSIDLPPNTSFLVENSFCRMHQPAPVTTVDNHEKDIPFLITSSEAAAARETIRQDMPEYAIACDQARQAILSDPRSINPSEPQTGDDITITTLGTGSAIPSKYRNVSSTHIDVPDLGGILLDAGEGTLGQMRRRFGEQGIKKLLGELRMIFISHMHADHHLGLNSVLEERFRLGINSPLFLIAPTNIALNMQESASWQYAATSREALENVMYINIQRLGFKMFNPKLKPRSRESSPETVNRHEDVDVEMHQWEKEGLDDRENGRRVWPFTNIYGFSPSASRDHWNALHRLLDEMSFKSIWAPVVPHRGRAFGLAIEHSSGWKIVYSGDTKPSEELVEAGRNATLLIHEATLEDDKPEVAAVKGHSTFSQAIDVGKKMKAKHILLNHFSQRYPKLPKLPTAPTPTTTQDGINGNGSSEEIQPVVSISFDFMSIKIRDMWKMNYYMEPLSLLFVETEEDGDGETVEGEGSVLNAVKNDVNPSLDGFNLNGSGSEVNCKKSKNNKNKNQTKDHQIPIPASHSSFMPTTMEGHGVGIKNQQKSKKSLKREAARAAKRPAPSPSPTKNEDQPLAKRRSTDSSTIILGTANGREVEAGMKVVDDEVEKMQVDS
ncbi:hypothetical protein I203_100113 [Kwoniella mangroviensis CBS 8507]|uniref:uncharacterized protein n=1 Tax=Kwoniella mangroviensis CBS 8507 TaxID=1296122 RepID=UPI00080D46C8|nr:uncharacterized protein I203_07925 [Kwoniella mangroviensis CBS 8507]OCF62946.1 hypothetical protein I203_07925 [Kwoniella mangroviensis CBS 8507]